MNALVASGTSSIYIGTDESARHARDLAVDRAILIGKVTDAVTENAAVESLCELRAIRKGTEEGRVEIKDQFLKTCQKIDATAAEFIEEVIEQEQRLEEQLKEYVMGQQMAMQAQALLDNAERELKEETYRHTLAKAEAAATAKEREDLYTAAAQLRAEIDRIGGVAVQHVEGLKVKPGWDWEITDANELMKTRPDFFEIRARKKVIEAAITAGFRSAPGIKVIPTVKLKY